MHLHPINLKLDPKRSGQALDTFSRSLLLI